MKKIKEDLKCIDFIDNIDCISDNNNDYNISDYQLFIMSHKFQKIDSPQTEINLGRSSNKRELILPAKLKELYLEFENEYKGSGLPDYLLLAEIIYFCNKEYDLKYATEISENIFGNRRYIQGVKEKLRKNTSIYEIRMQTYRRIRLFLYAKIPFVFDYYENHPSKRFFNHLNAQLINNLIFIFDRYIGGSDIVYLKDIEQRLNFNKHTCKTLRRNKLNSDKGNVRITAFKLLTNIHTTSSSQIYNRSLNNEIIKKVDKFKESCIGFLRHFLQGNNIEKQEFLKDTPNGTLSFLMCLYSLIAFSMSRRNPNNPSYVSQDYIMSLGEFSLLLGYNDKRRINHQFHSGFLFASEKRNILYEKLMDERMFAPKYFKRALEIIDEYLTVESEKGIKHDINYLKSKSWYVKKLVDFTLGANVIKCSFYTNEEMSTKPMRLEDGRVIDGIVRAHLNKDDGWQRTEDLTCIIQKENNDQFEYQILQALMLQFDEHIDFLHAIRQGETNENDKAFLIIIERVKSLFELSYLPSKVVKKINFKNLLDLFLSICKNKTIYFNNQLIHVWDRHTFTIHLSKDLKRDFNAISFEFISEFAERLLKKISDEEKWYSEYYSDIYSKYRDFIILVNDINEDSPQYVKWFTNTFFPKELDRIKIVLENVRLHHKKILSNFFTE